MVRAGSLTGFLVLVALGIGLKLFGKSYRGEDAFKEAHALVMRSEAYAMAPEYLDGLVNWAHDDAFEASYQMGWGRRSRSYFDETQYRHELFTRIIERCREDNETAIADALQAFYEAELGG